MNKKPHFASRWKYLPVPLTLKVHLFNNKNHEIERIVGLSKINIFVGENNSGKSRLFREIIKQKLTKNELDNITINELILQMKEIKNSILDQWETVDQLNNIKEQIKKILVI